jgi:nitroreductase
MSTITLNPETDTVTLPPPVFPAAAPLEQALQNRHSSRAYATAPLTLHTLSALLWAGFGINRPDTGGRTAPSAHNWQGIDVYVVLPERTFRYSAKGHELCFIKAEDLRATTGTQDYVTSASLNLVYVANFDRMNGATQEEKSFLAGADTGCVAQNVSVFCAAVGLGTVVRGLIDRRRLAVALG